MEVAGQKEVYYCKKLLYGQNHDGLIKKSVKRLLGYSTTTKKTKSEWAAFLNYKTSEHAHDFLDKLKAHDVLQQTGEKELASKTAPLWSINKKRLLDELIASEWYQGNRQLFRDLVDRAGDF